LAESDLGTTDGRPAASAAPQRRPFVPREERERRRREALDSLIIGEWREGRVRSVVPFGAFVDLGGIDGLVHISQLGAGGYVEKAEDVVQAGQTVRVRIVEIDKERGRVGLSMREPSAPRPPRPAPAERPPASAAQPNFAPTEGEDSAAQRGGAHRRNNDRPPQKWSRENPRGEARPRTRRRHDETEEDWRVARGGEARDYYAIFGDEDEEEAPAPTTPEELVARFSRSRR
jgi:predicted RNA-binding protein with RPS1 domain